MCAVVVLCQSAFEDKQDTQWASHYVLRGVENTKTYVSRTICRGELSDGSLYPMCHELYLSLCGVKNTKTYVSRTICRGELSDGSESLYPMARNHIFSPHAHFRMPVNNIYSTVFTLQYLLNKIYSSVSGRRICALRIETGVNDIHVASVMTGKGFFVTA